MNEPDRLITPKLAAALERHWVATTLLAWALIAAWLLYRKWSAIHGFNLGDTDDNLRLQQVRDWLGGQGWFDLRQHRLDPALGGADIHWSRLVDLPLAALMLLLKPLLGTHEGERWAIAIAPLLPLGLTMFALAVTVRRLVARAAYPLAFVALALAGSTLGAYFPTRIDHHGWQLFALALAMAGLADRKGARGGATVGLASGLSLAIGLEMVIYLALAAAAQALAWVADARHARRLGAYAAALAASVVPAFLIFASQANRAAVCDALSPVWLADALLGAGLLWGCLLLSRGQIGRGQFGRGRGGRLLLAALAGGALAAFHALAFPHCLSRLEGISPEAARLWLDNVKEARPVTRHSAQVITMIVGLPIVGLIGFVLLGAARPGARRAVLSLGGIAAVSFALLFWQTRAGPAAQLLAIPGAVAIVALLAPRVEASRFSLVRVVGVVALAFVGLGILPPLVAGMLPKDKPSKARKAVALASARCWGEKGLATLNAVPAATMLTHVDLGPRLVSMTHHRAIAGPYHRNDDAIVDVMMAFRGDPARARQTALRHRADYVLLCPGMSESTIYQARAPQGFYARLVKGEVPGWLTPVPLPKGSPFRLWKIAR